ncbi:IspD/TarI family cytidylyltransferase [Cellulomonas gilvus]|nr:2-C-methyl-D-erythritol 4-phosphate cytidylyltransferase [Cellulomonas gilvus]
MRVLAVLTAAGSGSRLGHVMPKALVPLRGEGLVVHAARRLRAAAGPDGRPLVAHLAVTAPAAHVDALRTALSAAGLADERVVVVPGGASRQASVAAGLAALAVAAGPRGPDPDDVVLVHDAARPFVPPALVASVAAAVSGGHPAVVPGLPVTDTVKRVAAADDTGAARVRETVPREDLRAVQTPQGFTWELLSRAHAASARIAHDEALAASDDAGLVERLGEPVWVVAGDARAAKITTAHDLAVAELLGDE